jgi:hypothetical protein
VRFFSLELCTLTLLSLEKQVGTAVDTISPLEWAGAFFSREIITVCRRWVALFLRFAFDSQR